MNVNLNDQCWDQHDQQTSLLLGKLSEVAAVLRAKGYTSSAIGEAFTKAAVAELGTAAGNMVEGANVVNAIAEAIADSVSSEPAEIDSLPVH